MTQPDPAITRLACPACSATLPVPDPNASFVTCPYCGSTLRIHHDASGVSLEVAQQMGQAIGQQVGATVGGQITAAQVALSRQMQEQQLQLLDMQIGQARSTADGWARAPKSRQQAQHLAQARQHLAGLEAQHRALYLQLYPPAPVAPPPAPRARPATTPMRAQAWQFIGIVILLLILVILITRILHFL